MAQKKRAVVSVTNDLYTDQRVHKVCLFLLDQGYDVLLIGRKRRSSIPLPERPYQTKRIRLLFEKGALFYAFFNVRLFFRLLFTRADVLVSNDLDTLPANYSASRFKRGVRLVYDSHEYFTGVPELVSRPKVQKIWLYIERNIFPKLKSVYTVNQSIADIYEKKYRVPVKIVRNISPKQIQSEIASKAELDIPENVPLIIIQGVGINIQRGAEEAVEAMHNIDGVLMIVGDGDVVPQLKVKVKREGLSDKVRFYKKRPYNELMQFTTHADIGLTLDKPDSDNYRYSLPNKLFDYIHTSTPVVATAILEVQRIVEKHDIGVVVDPFTAERLANAINCLISQPDELARLRLNCQKAAEVEHWENETAILREIYPAVE